MKSIHQHVHKLGMAAVFVGLLCAASVTTLAQTTITFDAPGAGMSTAQGTQPGNINTAGTAGGTISTAGGITGFYLDSGSVYHGFLRTP